MNGKELFERARPAWAQAAIIAYLEMDDCDHMTDYYATKDGPWYLIGWSRHTRDLFPEMRQAAVASGMPELAHFGSGDPKHEHREKYSMGAGYYLKAATAYSTGWKVEKVNLSWDFYLSRLYEIFEAGRVRLPKTAAGTPVSGNGHRLAVTLNAERNGVEIRFPAKPPQATLDTLKAHGWRWSRFAGCWYHRDTPDNRSFANSLTEEESV